MFMITSEPFVMTVLLCVKPHIVLWELGSLEKREVILPFDRIYRSAYRLSPTQALYQGGHKV